MAILNKLGAESGLALTQLRVCGILRDRRLRMAALAKYLGLEKSTMTGLVDRAEDRGLMARAPNEDDGRAIDVFLTKDARKLAERLEREFKDALAPLTGRLEVAEQSRLQSLLERMLAPTRLFRARGCDRPHRDSPRYRLTPRARTSGFLGAESTSWTESSWHGAPAAGGTTVQITLGMSLS
jgi:MarR family transcriptional regulator, organic hydroperoxide resistance regulator